MAKQPTALCKGALADWTRHEATKLRIDGAWNCGAWILFRTHLNIRVERKGEREASHRPRTDLIASDK